MANTELEVQEQGERASRASGSSGEPPRTPRRALVIASAVLPLVALALVIGLMLTRGVGIEQRAAAPIERLDFERIEFRQGEILAHVINSGPETLTIAHVQIGWTNRASWEFAVEPSPTLDRLGRAVVRIPYPWTAGEPYEIVLITENNLVFAHEVEMAAMTPRPGARTLLLFSLLGLYVGVVPVLLGIGWLPFLRALPERWYQFILSLTVGLLVFLAVDSLHEALETTERVPGPFQGVGLVAMGVLLSLLVLYAFTGWLTQRQRGLSGSQLMLAYAVAFGIGVHNLGEGLAIGAAYALGAVNVGAMLVLGFTLHNLTEGVAVVGPIVRSEFRRIHLLWLGLLAGVPTIFGAVLGGLAYSPAWAVLFLAIGTGAILQVVIEITRMQVRTGGLERLASAHNAAGFAIGMLIMYATGMLVTA